MQHLKTVKLAVMLAFCSSQIFSQKVAGGLLFTAGTSGSVSPFKGALNFAVDCMLSDKWSIGAGVTHTQLGRGQGSLFSGRLVEEGTLSRTNIGGRALFLFVKKPNLHVYTGLRFGASYWSGSGIFSPIWPITVENGDIIPTVQGVFGVRKMLENWIGFNAEIGIGAPYIISAGITCNIRNTKSAVSKIKLDYADYAVAEKKNVVKINLGTIFGSPGLSYERYLQNRFAVEFGASYRPNSSLPSARVTYYSNTFSEKDSSRYGLKAYGILKYYITARRYPIPKGCYLGANYGYINQTKITRVEDNAAVKNPISFDYERKTEQHSGGLVIGYQQTFGKRISLDAFWGPQLGKATLRSFKYYDPLASEEKFQNYFGEHQLPQGAVFQIFIFKMSVGYRF